MSVSVLGWGRVVKVGARSRASGFRVPGCDAEGNVKLIVNMGLPTMRILA